jgi:hypothetical protein
LPGVPVGEPQDRAIFANHRVHEMQIAGSLLKFSENPAGYDDDGDSAFADFGDCGAHFGVKCTIPGDGSIIVEGQYSEFHGALQFRLFRPRVPPNGCLVTPA